MKMKAQHILWNTMKAVLREKFIALRAYIKKVEKSHTSDLTAHLKVLEQKEADAPRRNTRKKKKSNGGLKSVK